MPRSAVSVASTLVLLGLLLAPGALYLAGTETRPRLAAGGPADAAAAAGARDLAAELQAVLSTGAPEAVEITVEEQALNGALASAARVVPDLAARADIAASGVTLRASLPAPPRRWARWLNLEAVLVPARGGDGIDVAQASVGRLPLPPGLVLPALRFGLDRALGDGLGTAALDAVAGLRLDPPRATAEIELASRTRDALASRVRGLTATAREEDRALVHFHVWWLNRGVETGALPTSGSLMPYLRWTVERAYEAAGENDAAASMRAGFYALALYCGDERFGIVIGIPLSENAKGERNGCARTGLEGRGDLRQHFVLSAALKAVTSASTAGGLGELKELLDSGEGGTGFSFDDMAANLAGARFAATLLALPREDWLVLLDRMVTEDAVLPPIGDLPAGLPEAEFVARFGDVDSPAYLAMIDEIERRIDGLPVHSVGAIN